MSVKKKHFLITLFNLKLWDSDKGNIATCTDLWMQKRFALFEEYCLPSVSQQTTSNFTWLCLLDEGTSQVYKERLESYRKQVPQLTPCYFNSEQSKEWKAHVKDIVSSLLDDEDYVITTNLDNDDSISKYLLEDIQNEVDKRQQTGLYTYVDGLQYFPHLKLLLKMHYPHNHFLTYVEDAHSDFKTTIFIRHAEARKKMQNIIDIKGKPYWMEVVHSNNVTNELRITSRIQYKLIWRNFDLQEYGLNIQLSSSNNRAVNLTKFPLYFIKIGYKKLLRKIRRG